MIIGIGCDIVEHDTTKILKWEEDISILQRIFSNNELDLYDIQKNIKFIADRFAAKEAVLKCLGGMQDGIALNDIEILELENRCPAIKLKGTVKEISDWKSISSWHVTITHSINYSIAFVIAER